MNPRATKRGDDLPMTGAVKRVRKGVYVVTLKFTHTRRHYDDEIVYADNPAKARESVTRMFPKIHWKGAKVKLPKVPKSKKPRKPRVVKPKKAKKK
jgi:hypothetical protein